MPQVLANAIDNANARASQSQESDGAIPLHLDVDAEMAFIDAHAELVDMLDDVSDLSRARGWEAIRNQSAELRQTG